MGVVKEMTMLVYCNGDSYTAGVNLNDSMIPNYPGSFTKDELISKINEITEFQNIKSKYYHKYVNYNDVLNGNTDLTFYDEQTPGLLLFSGCHNILEKKNAFPSELEKLDNSIKTINSAVPGASMGGICNRTILDLLELQSKNVRVDKVIIQLTSPGRYEIYDSNYPNFMFDRPVHQFRFIEDCGIGDAVILKYSNADFLIKYLYHLISLKETVRSITGHLPILIDSINGEMIQADIKHTRRYIQENNNSQISVFDSLVTHSLINSTQWLMMLDAAANVKRPYAHDGHLSAEVHKLTAKELIKLL
jgi:hypothetical protein